MRHSLAVKAGIFALLFYSTSSTAQLLDPSLDGSPIKFRAVLSADEQSAPTESPGSGVVNFVLDRPTQELSWTLSFENLTSDVTGAHIHGPQTPGGNAGVLIDLAPDGLRSPVQSSYVLNDGLLEYLLTGRMYVNVHSTKYPVGELRGQIMRQRPEEAP